MQETQWIPVYGKKITFYIPGEGWTEYILEELIRLVKKRGT